MRFDRLIDREVDRIRQKDRIDKIDRWIRGDKTDREIR